MGVVWRVQLLGGLAIHRDGTVTRPQSGRLSALLATLAYRPDVDHPRHVIADALWPDKEADLALHCLRQTIVSLRRLLEPPGIVPNSVVVASRAAVRLSSEHVRTDAAEFERAVETLGNSSPGGRLEALDRVIRAYSGELLPSLSDEWALIERERLAAAYVHAIGQAVDLLRSAGQWDRALEYALMAVGAAPTSEECAVEAMRLSAQLGRPATGVQAFRTLRSALRRACDAEPSPTTRALARELRRAAEGPPVRTAAPAPAPPPGSVRARLPHRGQELVGRRNELSELIYLLRPADASGPDGSARRRLVWLVGTGGCGKTRLSLEAASDLSTAYRGNCWFVPLAGVTDPARVPTAILDTVGGPKVTVLPPIRQVSERLAGRPSLLILDNLEHLQAECASTIVDLVRDTPSLVCLVTSRERLGTDAAAEMDLQPLPSPAKAGTPSRLMEYAAVQLFVERARTVSPGFGLTQANAAAVAALCRRLDGLPLAIELAAARSGVLTPMQMLSELAGKTDILVSRQHDREQRHRALRDTIAWSYYRLSEDLRKAFCELSVFRGGWGLAAARDVCDQPTALDHLEALWERSVIWARETGDEMRFGMLETMRQFADQHLEPSARAAAEERHTQHYLRLAERAAPGLAGAESSMWMGRLQAEQENLVAALSRVIGGDDGLRMANALGRYWRIRGDYVDGREWLTRALQSSPDAPAYQRARALVNRGSLAIHAGDYALAEPDLRASVALHAEHSDDRLLAEALTGLGICLTASGHLDEASHTLERSRTICQARDDRLGEAVALSNLGRVAEHRADLDGAARLYSESSEMFRQAGDERRAALNLANTGTILGHQNRDAEAQAIFERCIPVHRRAGDRSGLAVALTNLAESIRRQGDSAGALPLLHEAVSLQTELGDRLGAALSVWTLATIYADQNPRLAARLLSAVEAAGSAERLEALHEFATLDDDIEAVRTRLDERAYSAERQVGRSLSLEEAVECALSPDSSTPS